MELAAIHIGLLLNLNIALLKDGIRRLVWFEAHESAAAALRREKQLKEWKREWKINLLERDNPHWLDLYPRPQL